MQQSTDACSVQTDAHGIPPSTSFQKVRNCEGANTTNIPDRTAVDSPEPCIGPIKAAMHDFGIRQRSTHELPQAAKPAMHALPPARNLHLARAATTARICVVGCAVPMPARIALVLMRGYGWEASHVKLGCVAGPPALHPSPHPALHYHLFPSHDQHVVGDNEEKEAHTQPFGHRWAGRAATLLVSRPHGRCCVGRVECFARDVKGPRDFGRLGKKKPRAKQVQEQHDKAQRPASYDTMRMG